MAEEIRVDCIKVEQSGMTFYSFVLNSKELRNIAYVSRREVGPQGYQRYLSPKRLKEVGEYIKKPRATFPNSIIVNFSADKVRFEPGPNGKRGTLIIPKEEKVAWIIDGQHRLYGFDYAEEKEFDILVAAFIGLTISDQATIFKVINSTQKGVNPSLIYDLIDLTKDAEYLVERAHEIVKSLNADDDSPWKDMIKMIGKGGGLISQAAFIGELKKVLQDTLFKEYPSGEQIKILKDYFATLKELFPTAWGSRKHVLCKTLGVAAVLMIMPKVLYHCRIRYDFSQSTMIDVMKNLPNVQIATETGLEQIDFSGRQLGAFGGKKGQKHLAELLEKALPQLRP
jgi:DGQHR domain-containing protein